jgi:hypothetical protein
MRDPSDILKARLAHGSQVHALPWTDERIRWSEFIFCLLQQIYPEVPAGTRSCAEIAHWFGLTAPLRLSTLTSQDQLIWRTILKQGEWPEFHIQSALALLSRCAAAIGQSKPQALLRKSANVMRDTLTNELCGSAAPDPVVRAAVGHWLQNTCNLPLQLADDAVARFAIEHGVSADEVISAAEELDINLATLDDIVSAGPF